MSHSHLVLRSISDIKLKWYFPYAFPRNFEIPQFFCWIQLLIHATQTSLTKQQWRTASVWGGGWGGVGGGWGGGGGGGGGWGWGGDGCVLYTWLTETSKLWKVESQLEVYKQSPYCSCIISLSIHWSYHVTAENDSHKYHHFTSEKVSWAARFISNMLPKINSPAILAEGIRHSNSTCPGIWKCNWVPQESGRGLTVDSRTVYLVQVTKLVESRCELMNQIWQTFSNVYSSQPKAL